MTRGFTLTELLVVIVIILVLASISFPITRSMRESSQTIICTGNLKALQRQATVYALDNNNIFPLTVNPQNNYALELATNGYLDLSGDDRPRRIASWVNLSKSRAPFVTWCPSAEACESRLPYGNLATYGMNVNVGGTGGWRNPPTAGLRTYQIEAPARTAMFMDGCFRPGKGYDVRVGEDGFMPTPMHPPSRYKKNNNKAGSVNVVFVDGHVELRPIGTIPTDFTHPFWKAMTGP